MTGQDLRAILFATLAPSIFGVLEALIWLTFAAAAGSHFAELRFGLALALFVFAAGNVISFAGCLLLGVPAHLFLIWRRARSLPAYVLAGGFASLAVTGLALAVPAVHSILRASPWLVVPDVLAGGPLAAFAFWTVIRPDRPSLPA